MSDASEKSPGQRWRIGNQGAFGPRRNTASAFRRLGAANPDVITIERREFFGIAAAPGASLLARPFLMLGLIGR